MTNQEIKEGNKILEQFTSGRKPLLNGIQLGRNGIQLGIKRGMPVQYENWYDLVHVNDLKYHSSYDALMPAYFKFRDSKVDVKHQIPSHEDIKFIIQCHLGYSPIETVFEKLVHAVKWYNSIQENKISF